jgi:hypothetical protein
LRRHAGFGQQVGARGEECSEWVWDRVAREGIRLWCFFCCFLFSKCAQQPICAKPNRRSTAHVVKNGKIIIHDIESSMGYKRKKVNHSLFVNEIHKDRVIDIKSRMPCKT